MKNIFSDWMVQRIRRRGGRLSSYRLAKAVYLWRLTFIERLRSVLWIGVGVISAAFGLESFLLPSGFMDGGVTGISLLLARVSGWSLAALIVALNLPFMVLAYRQIGPEFAMRSMLGILGLALVMSFVHFPVITTDKLLVAAFGGVFLGAGIGLSVRGGGVLDGMEVLAIYVGRKTGLSIGDITMILNILIFLSGAKLLGMDIALYAILTYLAATRTMDFIIEGIEEYIGVTIVSSHAEEIRTMIVQEMERGVTIYQGYRGHSVTREDYLPTEIIFTVVTRLEVVRLRNEVRKIDPNAFVTMHAIKDTQGGILKRRPMSEH
jgi:uncharacterized membrane-anchored protein YitT (DUF2179 family)